MANVIDSKLLISEILEMSLTALRRQLLPLRAFATAFEANLEGNNEVQVEYYPLHATESETRAPGTDYFTLAADTATEVRTVTINKNKLQVLSYTNEERRRKPRLDAEKLAVQASERLAYDVIMDILSLVTAANFPGTTLPAVAAADFDFEHMQDLRTLCTKARWPKQMRSAILNPDFYGNLFKSGVGLNVQQAGAIYGEGEVSRVAGFETHEFAEMPDNDEDLAGLAVYQSAILVGFAPVTPTEAILSSLHDYQEVTDPDTGLTLQYKHMAKAFTGEEAQVLEIHYGYAKGEADAIKPIFLDGAGS